MVIMPIRLRIHVTMIRIQEASGILNMLDVQITIAMISERRAAISSFECL
jgi:hypothetical protein